MNQPGFSFTNLLILLAVIAVCYPVQKKIREDGVKVYEGSRKYLEAARDAGLRRAVVSSSANAEEVLEVTGLAPLIEARVDGVDVDAVAAENDRAGDVVDHLREPGCAH